MAKKQTRLKKFLSSPRVLLLCIFLVAAAIRLIMLGQEPAGFHVDELNAGYVGRYILTHGRDMFGTILPTYFNKFGDFRSTGIFYLSGLSTFIFGVTEFAVRFPSAILGALTVVPMYALTKRTTGKTSTGLIAASILALSPWHIVLSRATSEAVIALFFTLCGFWLIFEAQEKKIIRMFWLGAVSLFLGYFCYHAFRIVTPVMLVFLALLERKWHFAKTIRLLAVAFIVLTIMLTSTGFGTGRLSQVLFYKNYTVGATVEALLSGDGTLPITLVRAFHNKFVVYGREYANQYTSYFSPSFLFISGGYPHRYRIPEEGLFHLILAPMLLIGLFLLLYNKERLSAKVFVAVFLAVAPLPASITYEDAPNVHRSLPLIFPLIALIAYGTDTFFRTLQPKKLLCIGVMFTFSIILCFETLLFAHLYFTHADSHKSILRNEGNTALFRRIQAISNQVDLIIMPIYDELPMYGAFYARKFEKFPDLYNIAPKRFQIDKVLFVDSQCPSTGFPDQVTGHILFVDYDGCPGPKGMVEQEQILRSDSTNAYRIYDAQR